MWRIHKQRYEATDAAGSRLVSGRYHKGGDDFPPRETFPVIYTSLSPETSLAELVRHTAAETLPHLNGYRLTEIAATLARVVDCTNPDLLGVTEEDLMVDTSFHITRRIGEAVNAGGYEAARVPSASLLGDNLIIFPRNLQSSSHLRPVRSRDPRLRYTI